ncbi:MAG TPA: hypothetical protein VMH80_18795 [Bryobacteraceae bacterium]|nr:hypothetical protein [Bryobacteraceae bacterium]
MSSGNMGPLVALAAMVGLAASAAAQNVYLLDARNNQVWVIDAAANTAVGSPIPVGNGPSALAVTPDGRKVYVTTGSGGTVEVISTATNTEVASMNVYAGMSGIVLSRDGSTAYAAVDSGDVVVIDTASDKIVKTIQLETSTGGVVVTPSATLSSDGSTFYTVDQNTGTLYAVNLASGAVSATACHEPGGRFALALPNGKVYMTDNTDATVVSCDPAAGTQTSFTTKSGIIAAYGAVSNMILSQDGSKVYTAGTEIQVIDIATSSVTATITTPALANVLAALPDGKTLYAAAPLFVYPVNTTTGTAGATLLLDQVPVAIAAQPGPASTVGGPPAITPGGVVSASAFGGFTSVSPGSWIEIYGMNLARDTRQWAGSDFNGNTAPTKLDGTEVTIGGKSAFIDYISPTQVNALVASDTPTGTQQMTVTTGAGTSASYDLQVNPTEPGLLAPSSFKLNGVQYAVGILADGTYAVPEGAIAGVASRPAKPGETITLYGVGFGPVMPDSPAGEIVQQLNNLASTFQISIGGMPATASYSGLAPSYTGLYQFNVTVPAVAPGNAQLTFKLGGVAGTQTLYIAVGM